jgi:uncharacterized membrane protein
MNGTRGLVIAIVAALLVGFSLGMVSGIVFMRFAWPGRPHLTAFPHASPGAPGSGMRGPGGPLDGMGPGRLLAHLEAALDLTPEQRQAVLETLRQAHEQRVAMHESTRVAIERVLTEKQLADWRKMENLYQHDRREGRERGPADEDRP